MPDQPLHASAFDLPGWPAPRALDTPLAVKLYQHGV
jgi:hypothetical protein